MVFDGQGNRVGRNNNLHTLSHVRILLILSSLLSIRHVAYDSITNNISWYRVTCRDARVMLMPFLMPIKIRVTQLFGRKIMTMTKNCRIVFESIAVCVSDVLSPPFVGTEAGTAQA